MTRYIARAKGVRGGKGWSPLLAVEVDGSGPTARRVLKVDDWTGAAGDKPATGYLGVDGLTDDIAEAVDIRGAAGSQQVDLSFNASGQYVAGEIITLGELATGFEIDPALAVIKADVAPTGNVVVTIHIGGEVVDAALVGGTQVGTASFTAPGKTAVVALTETSWSAGALRLVGPTPADDSLAEIRGVFSGFRATPGA